MPAADKLDLMTRLRREAWRTLAGQPFYRYSLLGPAPAALRLRIGERWPGEEKLGKAILAGEIELAGETIRNPAPVWTPAAAASHWLAEWHSFGWLPDLVAVGADGREAARALIRSWLDENPNWHPVGWRADVLATRLFGWIVHLDELTGREADRPLRRAVVGSVAAQLRHLARTAAWEVSGAARLRALKGLVAGLVALGRPEARITRAVRALAAELPAQILPDGGHRTRNPSVQLQVLRDLIDTRAVLRAGRVEVPPPLQDAIERMAPILRFFRHGDRRLALFNNSIEQDGVLVDLVLTRSETKGRAPSQAPHAGFQRLQGGQTLVIVDAGRPSPPGFDAEAHAGTLSFEMSHERERIIVNCGGYRGAKPAWRRVARSSAAHSVLVVGDTNSVEIRDDRDPNRAGLGRGPSLVRCERAEEGGHQWISATHDGYRQRFGVTYTRQLYLAADGDDLRGEDQLMGRAGIAFTVRFHLHPAVEASLSEDGSAAVLRAAGGSVWRLRAAGGEMSLGESIYLGSGQPRRTQQIVLSGETGPSGAIVRWAIRRDARPRPPLPPPMPERGEAPEAEAARPEPPRPEADEPPPAAPDPASPDA